MLLGNRKYLRSDSQCEPDHKREGTDTPAFHFGSISIQLSEQEELMPEKPKTRRWIAKVTTDSTHPPAGLFTKDAATIARTLASKKVSPKGPASGMRMLTYFINRAGRGLPAKRRAELEKAKSLLSRRVKEGRKAQNRKAAA
jgi:Protein of unknown function (DUF3175)